MLEGEPSASEYGACNSIPKEGSRMGKTAAVQHPNAAANPNGVCVW